MSKKYITIYYCSFIRKALLHKDYVTLTKTKAHFMFILIDETTQTRVCQWRKKITKHLKTTQHAFGNVEQYDL